MSWDVAHILHGMYQLSDSSELSLSSITTERMFLSPDYWKLSLVWTSVTKLTTSKYREPTKTLVRQLSTSFVDSIWFVFRVLFVRSRGACDTYKHLLSDAMNQLRALHKGGGMSNNQANQFDRLSKAVEQVKSRPIWTPNTTRQQQAELIEQLTKELNKVFILHFIIFVWTLWPWMYTF